MPSRTTRWYLAVFAAGAAARLATTFRHGAWKVDTGYDASVYFAASDALVRGRLPYVDFILLHPPGLMLALSPFSALTHVMADSTAYGIALVAFALLGGLNAVLVVRVARRFGLSLSAALAGGSFYAVWFGAVIAEHVTKLEPVGNFLLLVALLFAADVRRNPALRRPALLAGAALGLAMSVKIWWIVPLLLISGWLGVTTRRPKVVGWLFGGAALAALVVNAPFFIGAPHAMWRSVIVSQLGRGNTGPGVAQRLADLTSGTELDSVASRPVVVVVCILVGICFVGAAVRAAAHPVGRTALAMLAAQFVVLAAAPSWFDYYADFVAVPLALIIAAAAVRPAPRAVRALPGWLAVAAALAVTGVIIGSAAEVAAPFNGTATLSEAVAHVRCVMSDSPMALIELDVLSQGLSDGCPNWIDVSGAAYGRKLTGPQRFLDPRWQREMRRYLRCGRAVIILRPEATGLTAHTDHAVERDGPLAEADGLGIYRVTDPIRGRACRAPSPSSGNSAPLRSDATG